VKDLILIAAAGESNELGKNGDLPWHLPDDFRHFKQTTTGYPMIMGRKTFDTFPKPLPNRLHIIVTRDEGYGVDYEDCLVVYSLQEALKVVSEAEKVFVIGGGEIYKQALPFATKIVLTRVHANFDADTFFPQIDPGSWTEISSSHHPADNKHAYSFTFQTFKRKV
jgi:dihydrofolate reductase